MTPTQPSQAVESEREKFEAWMLHLGGSLDRAGEYRVTAVQDAWNGWIARAELARPQEVAAPVTESMIAAGQRELEAIRRSDLCGDHELIKRVLEAASRVPVALPAEPFQSRVQPWMMACFGPAISANVIERNHRFLEESLELVQSTGCAQSEAHQLVDYVYGRPAGDTPQEVGGVMVTLAALCLAHPGLDMHACGEVELARIWTCVEKIRAKQAAKPAHSPLPIATPAPKQGDAKDASQDSFHSDSGDCGRVQGPELVEIFLKHTEVFHRSDTLDWIYARDGDGNTASIRASEITTALRNIIKEYS